MSWSGIHFQVSEACGNHRKDFKLQLLKKMCLGLLRNLCFVQEKVQKYFILIVMAQKNNM